MPTYTIVKNKSIKIDSEVSTIDKHSDETISIGEYVDNKIEIEDSKEPFSCSHLPTTYTTINSFSDKYPSKDSLSRKKYKGVILKKKPYKALIYPIERPRCPCGNEQCERRISDSRFMELYNKYKDPRHEARVQSPITYWPMARDNRITEKAYFARKHPDITQCEEERVSVVTRAKRWQTKYWNYPKITLDDMVQEWWLALLKYPNEMSDEEIMDKSFSSITNKIKNQKKKDVDPPLIQEALRLSDRFSKVTIRKLDSEKALSKRQKKIYDLTNHNKPRTTNGRVSRVKQYCGYTNKEIARMVGVSISTVKRDIRVIKTWKKAYEEG